jgi:hypothetical protein
MIGSFFQSLDKLSVDYLLISGQASVLYGAATFSEDIDLWIRPTKENADAFLRALRISGAIYYKLTPSLAVQHLRNGHGFHFVLPTGETPAVYLDVMGRPPRVGSFDEALVEAKWMDTEWGRVHVIGIMGLVELKKTQRLEDYPIIGRLVLARHSEGQPLPDSDWGMHNLFTLPELEEYLTVHAAAPVSSQWPDALQQFAAAVRSNIDPPEETRSEVNAWMQRRIQQCQRADRVYWHPIIAELRQLRSSGSLLEEGTPV